MLEEHLQSLRENVLKGFLDKGLELLLLFFLCGRCGCGGGLGGLGRHTFLLLLNLYPVMNLLNRVFVKILGRCLIITAKVQKSLDDLILLQGHSTKIIGI